MKCPKCQRENELTARLCNFCGSPLPDEVPMPQQLIELRKEIQSLRELVILISQRLAAVEQIQGIETITTKPMPAQPVTEASEKFLLKEPPPGPVTSPDLVGKISLAAVPSPQTSVASAPLKSREWEQILGGSWLARIGVLALIIGVGFFLKYAFDQNWLGPGARVMLGVVAGLGMLGGGYYWRKRYPTLSQALSGGGIAVLYLSIFAAFAFFQMLNLYLAVVLLFAVSAVSAVLSVRQNSMALAIIGILGAFIAPFILEAFGPSGAGSLVVGIGLQLLVYVMVVDLGVIALSTFRNWQWFSLMAFFGSIMAYGLWYVQFGNKAGLLVSEGSLTILFLMFVGTTVLYHILWRREPQPFDYVLMVFNAAAYFGVSYGLMWADLRAWMGGFSLLLALFYGGLSYMAFHRSAEIIRLGFLTLGIALVFLTIAVPIQLGDRAWTTIAWAAELVVLMRLSFRLKLPLFRAFGYGVFVVMGLRLLFFDTAMNIPTFRPILNERFMAFFVSIAATYLVVLLLRRERETMKEWATPASTFLVAANFFTLWLFTFELWNYFDSQIATVNVAATRVALKNAQNLSLTALWAFYAVILLVIGIAKRWQLWRLWALGLLVIPIGKVFVYDVWALRTIYRIVAFVGLGLLLLASAYLYQRYSKAIRGFIIASKSS